MKANQQGSFVTAEQIAKMQKKPESAPQKEPDLVKEEKDPDKKVDAVDKTEEFRKTKASYEEMLGVKVTEEDLTEYIFRGRIVKKDIVAIKNRVKVAFQTLTPSEIDAVDEYMAKLRSNGDKPRTIEGTTNLRTIRQLCYAWTEINGKALPKDIEKKAEAISQMGVVVVNRVVEAFRMFDLLVEMALREEEFLKK